MTLALWRYALYLFTLYCGGFFGLSTKPEELTSWLKWIGFGILVAFAIYLIRKYLTRAVDEKILPFFLVNFFFWSLGVAAGAFIRYSG